VRVEIGDTGILVVEDRCPIGEGAVRPGDRTIAPGLRATELAARNIVERGRPCAPGACGSLNEGADGDAVVQARAPIIAATTTSPATVSLSVLR
jgi:hypothetical protein